MEPAWRDGALEEARVGEYYGETRISVPPESETVGQDLLNRRVAEGQECGFSCARRRVPKASQDDEGPRALL